jgi:hypothetical protein
MGTVLHTCVRFDWIWITGTGKEKGSVVSSRYVSRYFCVGPDSESRNGTGHPKMRLYGMFVYWPGL